MRVNVTICSLGCDLWTDTKFNFIHVTHEISQLNPCSYVLHSFVFEIDKRNVSRHFSAVKANLSWFFDNRNYILRCHENKLIAKDYLNKNSIKIITQNIFRFRILHRYHAFCLPSLKYALIEIQNSDRL